MMFMLAFQHIAHLTFFSVLKKTFLSIFRVQDLTADYFSDYLLKTLNI